MNVYIFMVVAILLLALIMSNRYRSQYVFIACFIMFFVMGFRNATVIGNDSSSSYLVKFQRIGEETYASILNKAEGNYNIGFNLFMKFCYNLTRGNYQIFIIILSAIIMLSFAIFINKYSPSPVQSFCYFWGLLYYTFFFSAEKQALAMAILLFAFDAVIREKPIRFLLFTILAATVHFPALVFLPAYLLGKLNMNKGYIRLMAVLLAITYIFRSRILQIMMEAYGNEVEQDALADVQFFRTKVIVMILIVICALYLRPAYKQNRLYKTLLLFMCVAIVFQTFCGYNNIFERLADYYFYYAVIFIPIVFEIKSGGASYMDRQAEAIFKGYIPYLVCAFAILRFFLILSSGSDNLAPYSFYF